MKIRRTCLLAALTLSLALGGADAKGPVKSPVKGPKSSKDLRGGYSGKGVPYSSKSSKYTSKSWGMGPSKSHASSRYHPSPVKRPSPAKRPSASGSGGLSKTMSKYSRQRPARSPRPTTPTPSKKPATAVRFPTRPSWPSRGPSSASKLPGKGASVGKTSKDKPFSRPPTVFYPSRPRPPIKGSNDLAKIPHRYPGLRPPASGPIASGNTIINRPTTINQTTNTINNINNVTNVNNVNKVRIDNRYNRVNTATNVNNWLRGDAWRSQVTINSRHWNGRPWWHTPDYADWHHGHWHGNYYFRGRDAWSHVDATDRPWLNGLAAWGLGNAVYRRGYASYTNPYFSQPLSVGTTTFSYARPITVQLSEYERMYGEDPRKADLLRRQAVASFDLARRAFFAGNETLAYSLVNRAISLMPDDTSLHEFRALVLFAARRYAEAAEVIHAVLAVAPGWDWTTLSGLYADQDTYIEQLRDLEEHVRRNPRDAAARFLLGYHYITMGHPENAEEQLRAVTILQSDDRLAADLLALVRREAAAESAPSLEEDFDAARLRGRWRAERPDGRIDLTLGAEDFAWQYGLADNRD